ncbi:hypothetical protein F2Q68_00041084 [Brassica cretica]|uniref:Uncharacterized protein n=1 Tax=Brassica cretica TaxID=69181 RepID=A0A8S9MUN0_BRACR|nr:hypothetical protein F2Q68_00041084 [Brassica cretica]
MVQLSDVRDILQEVVKTLSYKVVYKEVVYCDCMLTDGVFLCTWCCNVGVDVACGGFVRCVVGTKLCVGVDVFVGIFDGKYSSELGYPDKVLTLEEFSLRMSRYVKNLLDVRLEVCDILQEVVKTLSYKVAYKEIVYCDCMLSDGVFLCTWCYDVGVDVACGGFVYCVVVTKLCVGVDVFVGIFDVR